MFVDMVTLSPAPIVGARLVSFEPIDPRDELKKQFSRMENLQQILHKDVQLRRKASGMEAYAKANKKVKRTQALIKGCQTRIRALEERKSKFMRARA